MKVAPIMREMAKYPWEFEQLLVHTGQHYDDEMSAVFFRELEIAAPEVNLGVGRGPHGAHIGSLLSGVLLKRGVVGSRESGRGGDKLTGRAR